MKAALLLAPALSTFLLAVMPHAGPATVDAERGPANVLLALKKVVEASDAGDVAWLERAFAERGPAHLYGWSVPGAALEEMHELDDRSLTFVGVGTDGRTWAAADRGAAVAELVRHHAAGVHTTILDARASCDSERASWVVARLERRYGEGEAERVQRVQVTAVMEYVGEDVHFRIWHWQAVPLPSPSLPVAPLPPATSGF